MNISQMNQMRSMIPAIIGIGIGLTLYFTVGWWGFLIIFPWIGLSITVGACISKTKKRKEKDLGRRITILMICPIFLIFLGVMQRENLQLEETVFYFLFFLSSGFFIRVLIHYAIAKIGGPFIWGRGFCGWSCWTAAIFDWLPIKENKKIPKRYGRWRYLTFTLSIIIPVIFILTGYDWKHEHVNESGGVIQTGKNGALIWFLVGNALYYITGITLAFIFKKKRAFCKILCPVSLVMKPQTTIALIKPSPTDNQCISCKTCNKNCPMDVDVMNYILKKEKIKSSECILCGICIHVCPTDSIKI